MQSPEELRNHKKKSLQHWGKLEDTLNYYCANSKKQ